MILAHVLFDGDIRRHPVLRSLLWQWGVTVGSLSACLRTGTGATVEDCDAVISFGPEAGSPSEEFCAMPDGAGAEGVAASAAAPLLVIGSVRGSCTPWISIPDSGPGGALLKAALRACEDRARELRGDPESRHDQDRYRDFLGHELRSPLTAAKTALSILEGDPGMDSGSARMLRIALRNLDRLEETVEWSQELGAIAEIRPAASLVPTSLASLKESMPDHLDVKLDDRHVAYEILTDCRLMGALAGQMERVLSCACPGRHSDFRLEIDPTGGECRLTASVTGDIGEVSFQGEWDHLSRMLISPHLLQVLGVRIRVSRKSGQVPRLSVVLPHGAVKTAPHSEPCLAV
jgi:hypothetical protein